MVLELWPHMKGLWHYEGLKMLSNYRLQPRNEV